MAALPPFQQPLGIYPAFVAKKAEVLQLTEKMMSLSGDSFTVITGEGQSVVQVKGEAFSLSGRKQVSDPAGTPLFEIRKEHFQWHLTYYGEDSQGKRIFEVKKKFNIGGSKQLCTFTAFDGSEHELLIKGDFFGKDATITDSKTSQVLAEVNRKLFNVGQLLQGKNTYHVSVAQGVDLVLVTALCICLDELREHKSAAAGGGGA